MVRRRWVALVALLVGMACAPAPSASPASAPAASSAPSAAAAGSAPSGQAAGTAPTAPAAWPPALQAAIDGARQEGTLDLVWGGGVLGGSEGVQQLQERINQKYGLNLTFNFTLGPAGPATAARILQEVSAGRTAHTDIHAVSVYPEVKEGFQSIDWREYVPGLPEETMYFDRRGVAWGTLLPGITYNSQLVPPDKAPRSLAELPTPQWKGQYAVPPYVVGRGIYALPEYQGTDRWFPLWRQMVANASGIMRCGESEHILSGEFPLFAIDCGDYEARSRQRLGQPLAHVIPAEGTVIRYWLMGVPVTARHPNAAKVFVSYILSREGQDFVWETDATDAYRIPGSHIAEVVKSYEARGVAFHEEYALLDQHPELVDIEREMLTILQQTQ